MAHPARTALVLQGGGALGAYELGAARHTPLGAVLDRLDGAASVDRTIYVVQSVSK